MGLNDLPTILQKEIEETTRSIVKEMYAPTQLFASLPDDSILPDELASALRVELPKLYRMAQSGMPHTHLGREYRFFKPLLIEWILTGKIFSCDICAGKIEPKKIDEEMKSIPAQKNPVVSINNKTKEKLARTWR
jgi:hypothetical protein